MPNPSPSPHPQPVYILGISCFYHDSAAALVRDGEIIFAAQEERYTRKKHDESFPTNAIEHALKFAGITMNDVSAVGFYEKPFLKFFDRMLMTFFKTWPFGYIQYLKAMQSWMKEKLWIPHILRKELRWKGLIFYTQHHESHAASSYFCSGFSNAAIVTVDGVGEWATTTIGKGEGNELKLMKEIHYPHSLGLLYSAITYYLGFKVNSAEYKVMGLAPYGEPKYLDILRELIDVKKDGSFSLRMRFFSFEHGMRMTGKKLEILLGSSRRKPETTLTQFHKDVARSLQDLTEEIMMKIVQHAKEITGSEYLCLAGGVALNCVANGKILRSGLFKDIFIQPAAGDAGGALGVALMIWHRKLNTRHAERSESRPSAVGGPDERAESKHIAKSQQMSQAFLGNEYTENEIKDAITLVETRHAVSLPYEHLSETDLLQSVASLLEGTNVIGWFQGRMEFGPRSLGNRSIIADARKKENWQKVNLKIKFRESFRPFAPTVLEERVSEYFDLKRPSPYMLLVANTKPEKRTEIPAVTHVDGSARIQTINRSQNQRYYDLLKVFEERTGCPVIINTSFNIRGEPIVESPEDAIRCFLGTDMDYLVMGNYLLKKADVPKNLLPDRATYLKEFALD
ncbi:MAG TPA: carbamoyltransferase [Candidatus Peribacterales bacterium]|nr:carbamoyltransferase [Candidatus Peribacterales bacterium]